ncbi:MAG: hypothetical protein HC902_10885 [Calothrix sp. SM1_5_4]|nr:hypothetical protein [Calothrix sp. SM1_5_4]
MLVRVVLSGVVAVSTLSCSVNILENFADKNTNEAYYADAVALLNDGDYSGALAKIALMTGVYPAHRKVVALKAAAHAGICGLTFIPFVQAMGDLGSTRLLPFLVSQFKNATGARIDACRTAEDLIESIGAIAERTTDENLLLALISFAKIGNVLSYYTDAGQDGTADAGVNPCLNARGSRPSAAVAGDFYESDLRELGTGITLALNNIDAISSSVSLGSDSLSDINGVCATLASINAAYDFCSITDPSAFTANHLKGIMSLIKEDSSVGLGTNCSGDISACNCP